MRESVPMQSVRCGSQVALIYSNKFRFQMIVANKVMHEHLFSHCYQSGLRLAGCLSVWLLTPRHWLQGLYAVVQMSGNHGEHTPALVCLLKKQKTTIILISALFRPLQQSGRLSSQGTWASLIHHREDLNHTAPKHLAFEQPLDSESHWAAILESSLPREANQNKDTPAVCHFDKRWHAHFDCCVVRRAERRSRKETLSQSWEANMRSLHGRHGAREEPFVWFWHHTFLAAFPFLRLSQTVKTKTETKLITTVRNFSIWYYSFRGSLRDVS